MRKKYQFNNWEYEIITENDYKKSLGNTKQDFYGYRLRIYKNGNLEYSQGGFGIESIAESYTKKFIIENEFGIELQNED